MTTTNAAGHCNSCERYGNDGVNFGNKYISEIMDAAERGQGWAQKIMEADRAQVRVNYLNPNARTNQNLYGALRAGVKINAPSRSRDESVDQKFQAWAKNLSEDFPPMNSYTPQQLGERAANLKEAARCLKGSLTELRQTGEIDNSDSQQWQRIVDTLEQFGAAAEKLHAAVCNGPDIKEVHLDVAPRRH